MTKVDSFTLVFQKNVSMEAGAEHSATSFESRKGVLWQPHCKYCSFLRHFVWFDVVLQWRERKDLLCTAAWISGLKFLQPQILFYTVKGRWKQITHMPWNRYYGILKGLAFLVSIWSKFRQGNFALSFGGVTNMVKIPPKSSLFCQLHLDWISKEWVRVKKRAILPWNVLKFGW